MQVPPPRQSVPFGMQNTPFDPETGRDVATEDIRLTRCFRVITEHDDYLTCKDWFGTITFVAKPFILRKKAFDGRTIGDKKYIYSDSYTRTVGGAKESLIPEYMEEDPDHKEEGSEILVAAKFKQGVYTTVLGSPGQPGSITYKLLADPYGRRILWEDLNEAGRTWIPAETGFHARLLTATAVSPGTLNQWTYTFEEVEKTKLGYASATVASGWTTLANGRTGTAYNQIEDRNTGAHGHIEGNGVDPHNLIVDSEHEDEPPATPDFPIKPITPGATDGNPVWMREVIAKVSDGGTPPVITLTTEYWFEGYNGNDGACPE